ncbi:MAG: hypothetical protein WD716_13125 [Fimbriimonadaceae bacterium]
MTQLGHLSLVVRATLIILIVSHIGICARHWLKAIELEDKIGEAVLYYDSSDQPSIDVAKELERANAGRIRVSAYPQDRLSATASKKLQSNRFVLTADGAEIWSYGDATYWLSTRGAEVTALRRGVGMSLTAAGLLFLAVIWRSQIASFGTYVTLAALATTAAMESGCISCSRSSDVLLVGSPLLMSGALALGSMTVVFRARGLARFVSIGVGLLALLVQAYLLLDSPKFCVYCLIGLTGLAATVLFHIEPVTSERLFPVHLEKAVCVVLAIVVVGRQSLLAAGQVAPSMATIKLPLPALIGRSIEELARGNEIRIGDSLVLVSSPTCNACRIAQARLDQQGFRYTILEGCVDGDSSKACIDLASMPPTPTFLIVDDTGIIRFERSGWPSDTVGETLLLNELRYFGAR